MTNQLTRMYGWENVLEIHSLDYFILSQTGEFHTCILAGQGAYEISIPERRRERRRRGERDTGED